MDNFQDYFDNKKGPFPKFIAYFTHDQIVSGFLSGLGFPRHYEIEPASGIFFEFFTNSTDSNQNNDNNDNDQIFVRTYFNTLNDTIPVIINGLDSNVISLDSF